MLLIMMFLINLIWLGVLKNLLSLVTILWLLGRFSPIWSLFLNFPAILFLGSPEVVVSNYLLQWNYVSTCAQT